jgi:hypothetical protein
MQRWILIAVILGILGMGGGGFAVWTHRQNRPTPMWVPILANRDADSAWQEKVSKELRDKLSEPPRLLKICQEMQLASKWDLASDQEAVAVIGKRLFVRPGEADTEAGRMPCVHVGMNGPRKDLKISGAVALRLVEDVWKILGIKPPAAKPD